METARKFLVTAGFCLLMLLAFSSRTDAAVVVIPEQSESVFIDDSVHAEDFLQPQNTHQLLSPSKAEQHFAAKYFSVLTEFKPRLVSINPVFPFYFQDIDRCEKVSVHLFPYHFFW